MNWHAQAALEERLREFVAKYYQREDQEVVIDSVLRTPEEDGKWRVMLILEVSPTTLRGVQ